jgi:Leucine-rich repeat (LRR) protein
LLSIAVIVLLLKDFAPNLNDIAISAETKEVIETAQKVEQGDSAELADTLSDGQRSLANQLDKQKTDIMVRGCNFVDADLVALKGRTAITKLDLETNAIDGSGLYIAMTLPNLRKLNVSDNPLSDDGVRIISRLSQVQNLEIKNVTLSNKAIEYIGQMKNLEKLELDGTSLEDRSLHYLSSMPRLRDLSINDQKKMSDRNLLLLANDPNLKMIDVGRTKVTGEGFANPARFPKLDTVVLKSNRLTEKGIQMLALLKNLKELDFRNAQYEVDWLRHLKSAKNLRKLLVSDTDDLARIKQMLPAVDVEAKKEHKRQVL